MHFLAWCDRSIKGLAWAARTTGSQPHTPGGGSRGRKSLWNLVVDNQDPGNQVQDWGKATASVPEYFSYYSSDTFFACRRAWRYLQGEGKFRPGLDWQFTSSALIIVVVSEHVWARTLWEEAVTKVPWIHLFLLRRAELRLFRDDEFVNGKPLWWRMIDLSSESGIIRR